VTDIPSCEGDHCITCSDEGVPMRAVERDSEGQWVCLDGGGARHVVMTDLVEPVEADSLLLVHAGVALVQLAPEAAA
jgi:hydrogenase maturation factor